MVEKYKKINVAKNIIVFFSTVLAVMGLLCNMNYDERLYADSSLEAESKMHALWTYFERIFSFDRVCAAVLVIVLLLAYYFLRSRRAKELLAVQGHFERRDYVLAIIFSICFSITQLFGKSYFESDGWNNMTASTLFIVRSVLNFWGWFMVSFIGTLYLFILTDHLRKSKEKNDFLFSKQMKRTMLFLFLCWLPYFIIFFPGTNNDDTIYQLQEYFHIYSHRGLHTMTAWGAEGNYIHNHHPYMTTVIFGLFAKIGRLLTGSKSITYGVALYSLLQMALFSSVFSYIWTAFRRDGLNLKIYKMGILFTALFPAFPLISICMIKDSLFCLFILMATIQLYEIIRSNGKILKNKKFVVGLLTTTLLMSLTKSQGIYIMFVVFVIMILQYRKFWKSIAVSYLIPVLFVQFIWLGLLLPTWKIAPAGHQELIGPLLQQTARYVVEHGDEVTKEEKRAIKHIMTYKKIQEKYMPSITDPIKRLYHTDATKEELQEYYKTWGSMFLKHPKTYFDATTNTCYTFFYVSSNAGIFKFYWENSSKTRDKSNGLYTENLFPSLTYMINIFCTALQKIPIVGLLFSLAFYTWLFLAYIIILIRRKEYSNLTIIIYAVLTILIYIIVPSAGSGRYGWPLIVMVPFIIMGLTCHPHPISISCSTK